MLRTLLVVGVVAAAVVWAGADRWHADRKLDAQAAALTGGDPAAGRAAIKARGCGGCHQVPGVPGAVGTVGPPLTGFLHRGYIAGRLDNSPDNLTRWIRNPQAVDPQTAMPNTGVGAQEAADIAAYLYSRR